MKHFTSDQSREAAVKNGRKGGQKTAKNRQLKADFQEAARWALEMETKVAISGEKVTISNAQAIVLNLLAKARNGEDKQCIEAAKTLIQLTGGNKSAAELRLLEAQAKMTEAKADLLTGADTTTLDKLDSILSGMKAIAEGDNAKTEPETE